ncbi:MULTISPECIES: NAD-dependent epimerase/dehydratase family protein [Micromonospora]|uniref:NAD-dependent epimerase/dehydratase family protein n=1 Tax=Micromonospora TaxID=1873 RepID=UPI00081F7CEF|nr:MULTISPECIES: NAD-dependent epimerase/dehydratase family protein [Micromonospora]MBQ0977669.1 NAD-dependent epimerase/dehydratase family protein [Micromonospora sp. M61]MBQ1035472.1 NAD-dependent epimerase/dehydratase family protein [Micromonospora sp. C81]TQJ25332.1 UDP-glucose 4-epimerase [Micromonospora sp. A202]WSK51330.1 NAD-dependent epimerase/dehydratase family protein [Micromonospora zamorensis]WTE86119.1 NAD-dependent epimerase/dehydratase family protein [Micromonospora zamorensis]
MTPGGTSGAPGVVVVTGVGRYLGAHVAARLAADPRIERVIGVDAPDSGTEFTDLLDRVERIRVDNDALGGLLADLDVDAVVHLALVSSPDPQHGGRSAMKDQNVIGTMHLLAACQRAPRLRKIVVRSSTAAYGVSFRDPAVFTEETEPREVPRGGFGRDILDLEGYVRGFRRRRSDVTATVLRFAPFIGSTADTTLTRYFAQPFVPTVFGRDPRLQFLHFDDALEVLHRSIVEDHPGTYNVAGPGVLSLSQAIRRAGRVAVPVLEPGLSGAAALARSMGFGRYGLDQVDLFVHGRVVDTSRLEQEYGFTPRSTAKAFEDFIRAHQGGVVVTRGQLAVAEQLVLDGIRQVRSAVQERP